jgi:predicted RNA binding protein YcfA (HicA-like mRNA interferase family)
MPKLRPLHWQVVTRVLEKLGYELYRTKGSHAVYVKSGALMHVTVPMNRKGIPVGTISSIIRQIGISREEFLEILETVRQ